MAFKEVNTLDAENTTALGGFNKKTGKKNPTSAEGYYLGSREVDSKKSKNGKASIHFLQTPKGNQGIWGKTDLDRKLSAVTPGTMVRITQSGTVPTPNGDMYKFKVEVDNDNTIEVNASSYSTTNSDESDETDTYSSTDDEDETDTYSSTDDEDEPTAQPYEEEVISKAVAMTALERQRKVEALLKGKRN